MQALQEAERKVQPKPEPQPSSDAAGAAGKSEMPQQVAVAHASPSECAIPKSTDDAESLRELIEAMSVDVPDGEAELRATAK
eukprot:3523791-Pyramimonas_sp.AAC.1